MAAFCVPKNIANKFSEAAKAGEVTVEKLYKMSSEERRSIFAKYAGSEMAKEINIGFEKAMASNQKRVFQKWAEATFKGKDGKARLKTVQEKINSLDKEGLLTPESEKVFLQDLVAKKLRVTVTADEARTISDKAKQLEDLSQQRSEFNTPTLEYFKAKKEMDDYLNSLTPSSNLKVATATIARGNMLFNLHSPLLNIESNTIQGFIDAAERRISSRTLLGSNNKYAAKYMNFAIKVYKKTGYDISRFEAQGGDRKTLGEDYLHSQGKGPIRKVGQVYEDLVFKRTQGVPDVAFSAAHFADSANLNSSIRAKAEGVKGKAVKERALAIFKDATSLEPQTKEGQAVRAQAMADALAGTYTNDTLYSQISLGIRKVFNIASGDFRAGDVIIPFVKTPANVLGAQLDASGVTVPLRIITGMQKTISDMQKGMSFTEARKLAFAGTYRAAVRAGLGLTFAYFLSNTIKPEEFIGQFPTSTKEQQLLTLRNATPNSIKVGDKWVSLDFLGPLGGPLLGFLYAKKYGKNPADSMFQYTQGVGQSLQNLPGLKEFSQAVKNIQNMEPTDKNGLQTQLPVLEKAVIGFLENRLVPTLVNDVAKITDKFDRETDKNDPFAQAKKQIPGLREELPVKKDLFGNSIQTEGWLSTLLFGSRAKTVNNSPVIQELVNLDKEGELPSITDVSKSSRRAQDLKTQIGEQKFNDAMLYFGNNLKENMQDTIDSSDYQDASVQEKKQMLDKVKETTFNDMLDEYGYEKPEK